MLGLLVLDRKNLPGGIFDTSGWRGKELCRRFPTRRILPPDRDPPLDRNTSLERDPRQSGLGKGGHGDCRVLGHLERMVLGRDLESGL